MTERIRKTTTFNKLARLFAVESNKFHVESTVSYLIDKLVVDSVLASEGVKLAEMINEFSSTNYEHMQHSLNDQQLISYDTTELDNDVYLEVPVLL